MRILFFWVTSLLIPSAYSAPFAPPTSPQVALETCQILKKTIASHSRMRIQTRAVRVPFDYEDRKSRKTLELFVWRRPGVNPSYPPLLFLHGGVGGSSQTVFDSPRTMRLLETYPGDFFSLDLRGEGCSKPLGFSSNLHPSTYRIFSIANTVRDLEHLRTEGYFRADKIRLFGQSRGSALVHHYFSLFPEGVESAHAHGFSVEAKATGRRGVESRAKGMLVAWRNYLKKYPQDQVLALKIKAAIPSHQCWIGVDGAKLCGPEALGILGIPLARVASYDSIHQALIDMIDERGNPVPQKITEIIGARWLKTVYREFNFVMGANGYELGSVGLTSAQMLRGTRHPAYFEAPFSEIRFLNEALIKEFRDQAGKVHPMPPQALFENYTTMSYKSIAKSLSENPSQRFFLYGSQFDGIAPLWMYEYANRQLAGQKGFRFTVLPNGHEDFDHEIVIEKLMVPKY